MKIRILLQTQQQFRKRCQQQEGEENRRMFFAIFLANAANLHEILKFFYKSLVTVQTCFSMFMFILIQFIKPGCTINQFFNSLVLGAELLYESVCPQVTNK